ncbi:cell division protein FtsI [Defluviimonas sp. 20V17]|uniref:Cell division protein FtsI n=1 Tax=Allgaiera indica TaxID=765699 RepID=A0AAN4USE8_9RHOB|nr:penicillin-binding protein 2 [Allgaiera indica]KDB02307.1 cell division protein FtsI [Defluviimonas sp. 20V17]GHE02772.1 cell division protein FtsI [Allgaiera indica]SDX17958.1 cell division protein FtsI (penicillin-binding protein 3) [Allgaiera indica]
MTRTPLRPLARILSARARGENPDAIERENIRARHEQMRDRQRLRAEGRLLVMCGFFFMAFVAVALQMEMVSSSDPTEPRAANAGSGAAAVDARILNQRADIVDRNGNILATNMATYSLYAQPQQMIDPVRVAKDLKKIFPELDEARMERQFTGKRTFVWIRKQLSPEQMQKVHDIGSPGLLFGPREMRLYPNGDLASHILGGVRYGREGVDSAELVGVAGIEKVYDKWLRDPANGGKQLVLSLDLTAEATVREVLQTGMKMMNAKGAAAILMNANTGEIVAMTSLPDFNPNRRPAPLPSVHPGDSPLFNRAVQGLYELGSTFKLFALAQALQLGLVTPDTVIDTKPFRIGGFLIHDFHNYGSKLSVTKIMVESSNIGAARIAQMIGPQKQEAFLKTLGLLSPTHVQLIEAEGAKPLAPPKWTDVASTTIAYGHGLAVSPLNLAVAYASILNGGHRVYASLVKTDHPKIGPQIVSPQVSATARAILRKVVTDGTATMANVKGYEVAGKTGTADKPDPQGGYYHDKVVSTFAGAFPANDPKYVLVVMLDEPSDNIGSHPKRTAGWTAVPVAAEIIRRVAPLLGMRPQVETASLNGLKLAQN